MVDIKKKISIIVPVYNVEQYLSKCLDSIISQTYKNIEIIIVNDGSTDSSGNICKEYAKCDNRIILLEKPNGGLSSARNYALDYIADNGGTDYISYVDSDDWVDVNLYQTIIDVLNENPDVEVLAFGSYWIHNNIPTEHNNIVLGRLSYKDHWGKTFIGNITHCVWDKVYRYDKIRGLRFIEGRKNEDLPYSFTLSMNKIIYLGIDSLLYYYRAKREGSIMFYQSTLKNVNIDSYLSLKELYDGTDNTFYKKGIVTYMVNQLFNDIITFDNRGDGLIRYSTVYQLREYIHICREYLNDIKSTNKKMLIRFPYIYVTISIIKRLVRRNKY